MALIACTECTLPISDKAASCPRCGAPVERPRKWTETKLKKVGKKLPPAAMLFGVASLVLIFVMPPVGLVMFMFFGLLSLLAKSEEVFAGKCPNCAADIIVAKNLRVAPCPNCKKPVVSQDGRFYDA